MIDYYHPYNNMIDYYHLHINMIDYPLYNNEKVYLYACQFGCEYVTNVIPTPPVPSKIVYVWTEMINKEVNVVVFYNVVVVVVVVGIIVVVLIVVPDHIVFRCGQ